MKRFAVPATILLASLVIALLLGEVMLRLLGYSSAVWYRPDPHLGWTLRPGVAAWFTKEGRAFVEVNSAGQRDREHRIEKPAGVYRIALLGDSYSEAMQVARDEAYWALLPERLQACNFQPGKRVEVVNFGVSGYGTAQEYLMLESTAMKYRPDLVLLQFTNGNDVRNNSFALEPEKERPFYMLDASGVLRIDDSFAAAAGFRKRMTLASEMFRKAADRSRLVQLLRAVREVPLMGRAHAQGGGLEAGLDTALFAEPRDPLWEDAWRVTEALLARTHDYTKRNGAQLLVVTVPYAIQVHPDRTQREALRARLGVQDLFYPDRRIAEFAKKSGISALPLAPEMQRLAEERNAYLHGFPNTGMGRGHWNPEGHRAAADVIARRLCSERQ